MRARFVAEAAVASNGPESAESPEGTISAEVETRRIEVNFPIWAQEQEDPPPEVRQGSVVHLRVGGQGLPQGQVVTGLPPFR